MVLRRSLILAALAAALALPTTSFAQARRSSGAGSTAAGTRALSIGGGLGFEFGDDDGFGLRLDGVLPLQQLSPTVSMGLVGTAGFTHWGDSYGGVDASVNLLKLVPAVRIGIAAAPKISLYGDAGLGLYLGRSKVESDFYDHSESAVGVTMRFAGGALVEVSPVLSIGGELGINPYFGDFEDTTLSLFATALVKL